MLAPQWLVRQGSQATIEQEYPAAMTATQVFMTKTESRFAPPLLLTQSVSKKKHTFLLQEGKWELAKKQPMVLDCRELW